MKVYPTVTLTGKPDNLDGSVARVVMHDNLSILAPSATIKHG